MWHVLITIRKPWVVTLLPAAHHKEKELIFGKKCSCYKYNIMKNIIMSCMHHIERKVDIRTS